MEFAGCQGQCEGSSYLWADARGSPVGGALDHGLVWGLVAPFTEPTSLHKPDMRHHCEASAQNGGFLSGHLKRLDSRQHQLTPTHTCRH